MRQGLMRSPGRGAGLQFEARRCAPPQFFAGRITPREDSGEEHAQEEEQEEVVVVGPSSVVTLGVPGTLGNDTAAVLRTV